MIIKVNKSDKLLGIIEGFVTSPIIESNEKELISKLEDELYRTCNWLTKKPPKDVDLLKIERINISNSVNNLDVKCFISGDFFKGEQRELHYQIMQALFSYKCMVESVENYQELDLLTNILSNIYKDITSLEFAGGLLEVGFKLLEEFDSVELSQPLIKGYMYKTLYVIVNLARDFYFNNRKNKQLNNSFMFVD